ncbi:MAG: YbhB/YbcL family Raf kinase inhibitor-like protein [Terracidiphilus sp.]
MLLACLALGGCHGAVPAAETEGDPLLVLRSTSFQDSRFANAFTCNGANKSPALNWSAPPAATRSLALILYDEDTPGSGFVHWVLFDLPPTALSLAETVPASAQLPDGSRQGRNDFGDLGYGGPCPLGHSQHHYIFVLFALDKKLNLPAGASRVDVDTSMRGHVLARGTLVETFSR